MAAGERPCEEEMSAAMFFFFKLFFFFFERCFTMAPVVERWDGPTHLEERLSSGGGEAAPEPQQLFPNVQSRLIE